MCEFVKTAVKKKMQTLKEEFVILHVFFNITEHQCLNLANITESRLPLVVWRTSLLSSELATFYTCSCFGSLQRFLLASPSCVCWFFTHICFVNCRCLVLCFVTQTVFICSVFLLHFCFYVMEFASSMCFTVDVCCTFQPLHSVEREVSFQSETDRVIFTFHRQIQKYKYIKLFWY